MPVFLKVSEKRSGFIKQNQEYRQNIEKTPSSGLLSGENFSTSPSVKPTMPYLFTEHL